MKFGECEEVVNSSKINITDKGSKGKLVFHNKKRDNVRKIRVDGCVLKEELACDYLLITIENTEYYIELKGHDINHAVKQIRNTINKCSINSKKQIKHSFIISNRCPLQSPQIQKLQIEFKKSFNSTLKVKNKQHEESI